MEILKSNFSSLLYFPLFGKSTQTSLLHSTVSSYLFDEHEFILENNKKIEEQVKIC